MCGIFAWAGKNPKNFKKGKFDITGIFNDERGGHSCGVTVDGEIHIGIDDNKKYKDFITLNPFNTPKKVPTVIGHTRKATGGAHNLYNAHPFGYGNIDGKGYEFIGVHNGSLSNEVELAEANDIEIREATGNNVKRLKIDSEILLECIYKKKNWEVLDNYIGAAALVFTNLNEPNVVYCYHGASKLKNIDTDGKIYEERPLFYYKESKNSLFISSLENSLTTIGGNEKNMGTFKHNIVYKITDGDIEKALLFKVNRSESSQKKVYSYTPTVLPTITPNRNYNGRPTTSAKTNDFNLHTEKIRDIAILKNRIVFSGLRYKRADKDIEGIYTVIPAAGFFFLGTSLATAKKVLKNLIGCKFVNGSFITHGTKLNKKNRSKATIPFKKERELALLSNPPLYYFFDGIRLKTEMDYNAVVEKSDNGTPFTTRQLSECSSHPILDNSSIAQSNPNFQNILKDSQLFTGKITPLLSTRTYEIVNGNCIGFEEVTDTYYNANITTKVQETNIVLELQDVKAELLNYENDKEKSEPKQLSMLDAIKREEDKSLSEDLTKMVKLIYENVPVYVRNLETSYPKNEKAYKYREAFSELLVKMDNLKTKKHIL